MSSVRHDADAYARYLRGMDASMRVKVALTAAHVLGGGRVADMGMGSGAGSAALAGLYPGLEVVGVDLDPHLVERARQEHVLPNLSFVVGDVAQDVFAPGSLAAVFDSSVLHHVTSFGGYDRAAALRALTVQARALAIGGVLIVRDFLDPDPPGAMVELELVEPGEESDDPRRASSAALLCLFARQHRALSDTPGFPLERLGPTRFRLTHRHAVEFVLRKDYREDWEAEVREEYTFATLAELVAHVRSLGLRVLSAQPLRNPWIHRHRFVGKVALRAESGEPLDLPATNFLLAAQRVAPGEGVAWEDRGPAEPTGFLEITHHTRIEGGAAYDLVRRPGTTIDVVPWFRGADGVSVVLKSAVPRPIVQSALATPLPCGTLAPTFSAEPLHARMTDRPLAQTVEDALAAAGIGEDRIRAIAPGTVYYPSPGGLQEEVRSVFVQIEPLVALPAERSGRVQSASAEQLLRAAQVGGLFDARLELNVRTLLARLSIPSGPWLGDLSPPNHDVAFVPTTLEALLARPPRRAFRRSARSAGFLSLAARRFVETDASGTPLREWVLDVVTPKARSSLTAVVLPVATIDGVLHAGIDDDDLPAAQAFVGSSAILVAPAFRVPVEAARSLHALEAFTRQRLSEQYGLSSTELFPLGGLYGPSPGATPEVVYPFCAHVAPERPSSLRWVSLLALARSEALTDGHLRIVVGRAAQAFGLV